MDSQTYLEIVTPPTAETGPMVIEVTFLSDRIMASSPTDRTAPEWPLHHSRFHSAAVSALHSITQETAREAGEAALRWMETLGPPDIHAAPATEIPALLAFVPPNDEVIGSKGKSAGLEVCLPDSARRKKSRVFPGVTVPVPTTRYAWQVNTDALTRHRTGLQHVMSRIGYLGRSVNFVLVRLLEIPPEELPMAQHLERWTPAANGVPMRTIRPGRLDRLRELHARGADVDRGPYTFYRRDGEGGEEAVFTGPWNTLWTAFALPGLINDATDTELVAKAIRRALIQACTDAAPGDDDPALRGAAAVDPYISGHEADGSPSRIDRLAVVPLANIMHDNADGRMLGFALLMPSSASPEQWQRVSQIVYGHADRLLAPLSKIRLGQTEVEVKWTDHGRLWGLSSGQYVAEARIWTTVTPILLARWPYSGRRNRPDPAETARLISEQIGRDCVDSGFPAPVAVVVSQVSHLQAIKDARAFGQHRGGPVRWATHATITFPRPVTGPVLIGAGRYNGLGLLTPDRRDQAFSMVEPVREE